MERIIVISQGSQVRHVVSLSLYTCKMSGHCVPNLTNMTNTYKICHYCIIKRNIYIL